MICFGTPCTIQPERTGTHTVAIKKRRLHTLTSQALHKKSSQLITNRIFFLLSPTPPSELRLEIQKRCASDILVEGYSQAPANTQRRYNVAATSRRCSDVDATLCLCWANCTECADQRLKSGFESSHSGQSPLGALRISI